MYLISLTLITFSARTHGALSHELLKCEEKKKKEREKASRSVGRSVDQSYELILADAPQLRDAPMQIEERQMRARSSGGW